MGSDDRTPKLLNHLRVLAVLFDRRGKWIDGNDLAQRAGVQNRTANAAARAWLSAGVPIQRLHERVAVIRWKLDQSALRRAPSLPPP